MKLLTDDDLETLRKKYSITVGQFALLRNVHDDLRVVVDEEGFELVEETPSEAESKVLLSMDKNSTSEGVRERAKAKGQVCLIFIGLYYYTILICNIHYTPPIVEVPIACMH